MTSGESKELNNPVGRKYRYFYGWNIVAASLLAHLAYAEHYSSMLGFFFKPLQNEFGWSRSAIAVVQSIARLIEAVSAPLVGPIIDRHGPRVLMPIGAIITGLTLLAITQINALWQFYLLRGVMVAVGYTLMGHLVTSVAINNWFIQKRGRAIAISRLGSNLSNIIFIPVTVFVIAASGWRAMFVIFAIFTWLVVLIPSVIFMRRRPEDMGLYPDGIKPNTAKAKTNQEGLLSLSRDLPSKEEPIWNRREILGTKVFWLLTATFGIQSMSFQGINISLAPYIQDLGYGETMLASVMTFRTVIAALSLPFMGLLAERANRTYARVTPFVIQCIGVFLLISAERPTFLWLAVALYGLGLSGVQVVQEVIWANYFGRLSLGMVRSMAFLAAFGLGATGPIAMNIIFDLLGSYHPALFVIISLFMVSAFIISVSKPPKAHRFTTTGDITPSAGDTGQQY